jgi:hypothetical protein
MSVPRNKLNASDADICITVVSSAEPKLKFQAQKKAAKFQTPVKARYALVKPRLRLVMRESNPD